MSNRRRPRSTRPTGRSCGPAATTRAADSQLAGLGPWMAAMLAADEAERRGDVISALEEMAQRPLDPDGAPFWRLSRVLALQQLAILGPTVPGWAVSRWICAQALRHLDEQDRGPRSRHARAIEIAVDLRGGAGTLTGRDHADKMAGVMDHDWVYRQLHLYELGGLAAFLAGTASGDLVAGADHVGQWVGARMGGFCFLGPSGPDLTWLDLASGRAVTTPNIGTAAHLRAGDHVLGRLVPITQGVMFEGPVLWVPHQVALDVAASPSDWLDVLRAARHEIESGDIPTHPRQERGLLSDISIEGTTAVLSYDSGQQRLVSRSGDDLVRAALRFAREMLGDEATREQHALDDVHADEEDFDPASCDLCFDDGWDGWAELHAALLVPAVAGGLGVVVGPADLEVLEQVRAGLAEPAASLVGLVLDQARRAA